MKNILQAIKSCLNGLRVYVDKTTKKLATQEDTAEIKGLVETAQATADNAQTTAETAQATADNAVSLANNAQATAETKMNVENPVGTGSFSMGRKSGSIIGTLSHTAGENIKAERRNMFVIGRNNNSVDVPKYGIYMDGGISNGVESNAYVWATDVCTIDEETGELRLQNPSKMTMANALMTFREPFLQITTVKDAPYGEIYKSLGTNYQVSGKTYYNCHPLSAEEGKKTYGDYAFVIGNGKSAGKTSDAHTLDWDGNAWYAGDVYAGSTSGTNKDEGSKKLATEEYVDASIGVIASSTEGSTKKFRITVDDSGTLSAVEITE